MNLSVYIVLAAAVVSVVFAQESANRNANLGNETISLIKQYSQENLDANVFPNATILMEKAFINATNYMLEAEDIITKGVSKAQQFLPQNSDDATFAMQQAFDAARIPLYNYGIPSFKSLGISLVLSNEEARQGMKDAATSIQKAGLASLSLFDAAASLFNGAIDLAAINITQTLFEAVRVTCETGIAVALANTQESIHSADKALINAHNNPVPDQDNQQNCESYENDPEASDAIADLNAAANNALESGGNSELVEKLMKDVKCIISDIINKESIGPKAIESLKTILAIDASAAKLVFLRLIKIDEKRIKDISSNIYLMIGGAALKSGSQSNNKIEAATRLMEKAEVQLFTGLNIAKELIKLGFDYQGEPSTLTLEALAKIHVYEKTAFLQAIVKSAKLVLSVL